MNHKERDKKATKIIGIDLMSVLLCLMVVFIHISSEVIGNYPKNSRIYLLIFIVWKLVSFAVPAFIFVSGFKMFLSKKSLEMPYFTYLKKRVMKILIPYLIWMVIYYIYFLDHSYFKIDLMALIKYIVLGNLVSHFYFIIIIFQFYLLLPVWKCLMKFKSALLIALIIMLGAKYYFTRMDFLYRDRIFLSYIIYWVLGCSFGKYYKEINERLSKLKWLIIVSYSLLTTYYIYKSANQAINHILLEKGEYWHILFCTVSIIFTYYLCMELSKGKAVAFVTEKLSPLTFTVYLSHVLFIFIINDIMTQYNLTILYKFAIKALVVYPAVFGFAYCTKRYQTKPLQKDKGGEL